MLSIVVFFSFAPFVSVLFCSRLRCVFLLARVRVPHALCFYPFSRAALLPLRPHPHPRPVPTSLLPNRQLPTERTPNTSTQSILAGLTPVLGAFPALRTLDLSPTAVDGVGRGNALEEAALCTTWARACPALRCVVFPSGAVWRRRGGGEDGEGQGQGHGGEVWVPEAAAGVVWTRY